MTKESERAFIHQSSVGDLEGCLETIKIADRRLQKLYYEERTIRGYRFHIVEDIDHLESMFIDWVDYSSVTNGEYPFLYVAIQPFNGKPLAVFLACWHNHCLWCGLWRLPYRRVV